MSRLRLRRSASLNLQLADETTVMTHSDSTVMTHSTMTASCSLCPSSPPPGGCHWDTVLNLLVSNTQFWTFCESLGSSWAQSVYTGSRWLVVFKHWHSYVRSSIRSTSHSLVESMAVVKLSQAVIPARWVDWGNWSSQHGYRRIASREPREKNKHTQAISRLQILKDLKSFCRIKVEWHANGVKQNIMDCKWCEEWQMTDCLQMRWNLSLQNESSQKPGVHHVGWLGIHPQSWFLFWSSGWPLPQLV